MLVYLRYTKFNKTQLGFPVFQYNICNSISGSVVSELCLSEMGTPMRAICNAKISSMSAMYHAGLHQYKGNRCGYMNSDSHFNRK